MQNLEWPNPVLQLPTGSAMSGQTASNTLVACGVSGATCTKSVQRKRMRSQRLAAATTFWRMVSDHIHPHRGCSHTKEEMLQWRTQRSSKKGPTGKLFSSKHIVPGQSFAAALRGDSQQQQPHLRQTQKLQLNPVERTEYQSPMQPHTQKTG